MGDGGREREGVEGGMVLGDVYAGRLSGLEDKLVSYFKLVSLVFKPMDDLQ